MKKSVAVLSATAVLALTGCSPQLSTSETCIELKAITSFSQVGVWNESPAAQTEFFGMVDKLAGQSSDTLKDFVSDIGLANRERVKPAKAQDSAKLEKIQERLDAKKDMVWAVCKL